MRVEEEAEGQTLSKVPEEPAFVLSYILAFCFRFGEKLKVTDTTNFAL